VTPVQPDPLLIEFHLLDRQIVDIEGQLVGKVDDVELEPTAEGGYRVVALLTGRRVLGDRVGGLLGRLVGRPASASLRIAYDHVREVGSHVTLSLRAEVLDVPPLEGWLREHLIGRIPGAEHAGE
jgi:sporulation protein YlmC with PRC-barrel domain